MSNVYVFGMHSPALKPLTSKNEFFDEESTTRCVSVPSALLSLSVTPFDLSPFVSFFHEAFKLSSHPVFIFNARQSPCQDSMCHLWYHTAHEYFTNGKSILSSMILQRKITTGEEIHFVLYPHFAKSVCFPMHRGPLIRQESFCVEHLFSFPAIWVIKIFGALLRPHVIFPSTPNVPMTSLHLLEMYHFVNIYVFI